MKTTETMEARAIRVERRDNGVAVVLLDLPDQKLNTLNLELAEEFGRAFEELERDHHVRAVVFASGKPDHFLVGADVKMLQGLDSAEHAEAASRQAQEAMARIERFGKPVVAAVHGTCLGGGLELAMACHGRVASDDLRTKLGLPEVMLGLLPGAGGTQRLPRLVGLRAALDMMLTGKQVDARKALKLGLVDEVVPAGILVQVAATHALRRADQGAAGRRPAPPPKPRGLAAKLGKLALERNSLGRGVVYSQALKQVLRKTRGNYPAPGKIVAAVKAGLEGGPEAGYPVEARGFGELAGGSVAPELMRLFFATRAMEKDTGVDDPTVQARPLTRVGVLGGGLMGAGIAYVTASRAGKAVRLKDRDDASVARGLKSVWENIERNLQRRKISRFEADRLMSQVTGVADYSGFQACEMVIEAVFEDLELKRRVLREVEDAGPPDVIFASNTSSLPITQIAEASRHPETVIGMHYFSPVPKMPLLEIIVTDQTAPWVTATCVELGKKQGKNVIVVRDGTGFYTSRVLAPYMNEAFHVLSEGVAIEKIDRALLDFGFPVGPVKLTDEVGIDVGGKVMKIMHAAFGERMAPPPGFEKLLADDRQGRKNGRGFYLYGGKQKGVDPSVYRVLGLQPGGGGPDGPGPTAQEIAWRCTLGMVNEAILCLQEGILRSPRDGDIGAIFGLGFPPFLGGPFRLADKLGASELLKRMEALRDKHGVRFEPAALLADKARKGETFYTS